MTFSIFMATLGLCSTMRRKTHCVIPMRRMGVSAVTVAVRGPPSSEERRRPGVTRPR